MTVFAELRPQIGIAPACVALSINRAGVFRRWDRWARRHRALYPRKQRPRPPLALSEAERSMLLLILNSVRFADLAPAAVFAILLDEGRYHGSVRTMYRLLAAQGQSGERRSQGVHPAYKRPELLAVRPDEVFAVQYALLVAIWNMLSDTAVHQDLGLNTSNVAPRTISGAITSTA